MNNYKFVPIFLWNVDKWGCFGVSYPHIHHFFMQHNQRLHWELRMLGIQHILKSELFLASGTTLFLPWAELPSKDKEQLRQVLKLPLWAYRPKVLLNRLCNLPNQPKVQCWEHLLQQYFRYQCRQPFFWLTRLLSRVLGGLCRCRWLWVQ